MAARKIHPFSIDGEFISDAKMAETRAKYENLLVQEARISGYVPVLDLDSSWSPQYDYEDDRWFFSLTVYAVYVGKRRAHEFEGMTNNCLIPIQNGKPEKSSKDLE